MSISLPDFFRYYSGTPEQKEAIVLLEQCMPAALLQNDSAWVIKYREQPEKQPSAGIVTPQIMEKLTGYAANLFPQSFCDDCNNLFEATGFDLHLEAMQMLMANMLHETGCFRWLKELASGDQYEFRVEDLGNTQPGDGRKYKGGGVLQLTGRANYAYAAERLNDPKILELGVDYVAEHYPFTSAIPWIEENNLLDVCLSEGFDACCVLINGGWNGYAHRKEMYSLCQIHLN